MAADVDTARSELNDAVSRSTSTPGGAAEDASEMATERRPHSTTVKDSADESGDDVDLEAGVDDGPGDFERAEVQKPQRSNVRVAITAGLATLVALTALLGWLGWRTHVSHQAQQQRAMYIQVARQGALNLTTIDWQHADSDVRRILDSATGQFYDELSKRQQPFIEVVKKAQSKSVGTINEAGLVSKSPDGAQVLVLASIKTSNLAADDQSPRVWRLRISVQKSGDEMKVSNVEFVS